MMIPDRLLIFEFVEAYHFLNQNGDQWGYAVFGKVTKGMNVVDKIVNVPTGNYGMHQNVPKQPIKIISVQIKK